MSNANFMLLLKTAKPRVGPVFGGARLDVTFIQVFVHGGVFFRHDKAIRKIVQIGKYAFKVKLIKDSSSI